MITIAVIPIAILISTVVIYFILGKGIDNYLMKVERKTRTVQRISLLLVASDFVSLFSSSESRNLVEKLSNSEAETEDDMFDSLSSSFGSAGLEISQLYREMNKAYKPSEDLSRIKLSALYLKIIVLFYGVSISVSQFVILYLLYYTRYEFISFLNSDLVVATILFSSIVVFIIAYILRISQKIEIRFSNLEKISPDTM